MPAKIVVDHVRKGYATDNGQRPVLEDISLSVDDGELLAIVGPSGCGKSTLLNVLAGFERSDHGTVRINGIPLQRPSPKGILISQNGSVFPWMTVKENLMFGLDPTLAADAAEGLADNYAALVGLTGFEHSYPHELSGGMLKRAELARALVVKPEILYMDEPFSALDALMSLRIRAELLRILAEEKHTVVLVTHDVEEAVHLADRVVVLSERPTSIKASFAVPFPHPRTLTHPDFQALRHSILRELGVENDG